MAEGVEESQKLEGKHPYLAALMDRSVLAMACLCSPDCSWMLLTLPQNSVFSSILEPSSASPYVTFESPS